MLENIKKGSRILRNIYRCQSNLSLEFVPKHEEVLESDFELLKNFIRKHDKILVLTGAGISTESGNC